MRLAEKLGRTVEELLDTISYDELLRWGEKEEIDPYEPWRADVRSAQQCGIFANVNRDPKKRPEPFEIKDFMLFEKQSQKAAEPTETKIDPKLTAWLFAASRPKHGH